MIDLDYIWIEIECPNCNYRDEIQLIDAKSEKIVFCNNCKSKIQLTDSYGSVHNSINNINEAFKSLENTFKNFGK